VRDIATVINALLRIIPEDEVQVRRSLAAILEDRWNPPEALWYKGALAFYDRFGENPPESGWGKEALDVWTGRDVPGDEDGLGGSVMENDGKTYFPRGFFARLRDLFSCSMNNRSLP